MSAPRRPFGGRAYVYAAFAVFAGGWAAYDGWQAFDAPGHAVLLVPMVSNAVWCCLAIRWTARAMRRRVDAIRWTAEETVRLEERARRYRARAIERRRRADRWRNR